jgi:2C-methyl-D-erythritol 2,4-cyclodiphosphate synthase
MQPPVVTGRRSCWVVWTYRSRWTRWVSDAFCSRDAVIDALCGAAGLGDIGTLFPPGDPALPGAS